MITLQGLVQRGDLVSGWQVTADAVAHLPTPARVIRIHDQDFPVQEISAVGDGTAGSVMVQVGERPVGELDLDDGRDALIVHVDEGRPRVVASVAGSDGHTAALVLLSRRAAGAGGVVPGLPMLAAHTEVLMTDLFGSDDVFLCAVAGPDKGGRIPGEPIAVSSRPWWAQRTALRRLVGRRPTWPMR